MIKEFSPDQVWPFLIYLLYIQTWMCVCWHTNRSCVYNKMYWQC